MITVRAAAVVVVGEGTTDRMEPTASVVLKKSRRRFASICHSGEGRNPVLSFKKLGLAPDLRRGDISTGGTEARVSTTLDTTMAGAVGRNEDVGTTGVSTYEEQNVGVNNG